MKADRIKELTARGNAAETGVENLDQEIAIAIADGVDDEIIADMRRRRRELIEQASDLGDALLVLEKRAADPREKLQASIIAGGLRDARREADTYIQSAAAVDAALVAVEKALTDLRKHGSDLSRALRIAGVDDQARLSNTLHSATRWAIWKSSPSLAELAQVPHTPANKRYALAHSMRRVMPAIPE